MGLFQSTLPVRGGTAYFLSEDTSVVISIHPPREGRDIVPHFFRSII